MSIINNLKLVNTKRSHHLSPIHQKRNKLIKKLWEQMEYCRAKQQGEIYAPLRLRTVKNKETGEKITVQMPKRVRPWYWLAENGKVCLSIHYGAKVINLAKGMTAIELEAEAEVLPTLEKIKAAVEAGELDQQIESLGLAMPIFGKKGDTK
jgi:hypothetical protein